MPFSPTVVQSENGIFTHMVGENASFSHQFLCQGYSNFEKNLLK